MYEYLDERGLDSLFDRLLESEIYTLKHLNFLSEENLNEMKISKVHHKILRPSSEELEKIKFKPKEVIKF